VIDGLYLVGEAGRRIDPRGRSAVAVGRYQLCVEARHQAPALARFAAKPPPTKVAAIALANKLARMARAMMAKDERYKEPVALAR
jgi:transposase